MMVDLYVTDKWIQKMFEGWFDPCSLSTNEEMRSFDGVNSSWGKKTFCNPPYSNPLPWVETGIYENRKGKTVVFLLKHDSSTKWYTKLKESGARFLMVEGRLRYETGKCASFPSMLAVLEGDDER